MSEGKSNTVEQCLPLLLQTPPGQLKHVLHDLQGIVSGGSAKSSSPNDFLLTHAQPYLEQHNHEQLMVAPIEVDGKKHDAIVCPEAKVDTGRGARYLHPKSKHAFTYDHAQETATNIEPYTGVSALETLRNEIDERLGKYVYNHFHTGVSSVFTPTPFAEAEHLPEPQEEGLSTMETETVQIEPEESTEATVQPLESMEIPEAAKEAPKMEAPSAVPTEEGTEDAKSGTETITQATEPQSEVKPDASANSEHTDAPAASAPSAVTPVEDPVHLTIHIVGNKYNLRNFWSGRWRSTYVFDPHTAAFVSASIRVNAHYFENGNVQLNTENNDLPVVDVEGGSPETVAKAIVAAIEKHEQEYQTTLFATTDMLRDRAFKALRRTLPITRQKIDWDKAVSYKLGAELANQ
ncbi:hypothetical protein CBS9595_002265 [Malassezia furfur]|nr:hypothetical protein CBS9595_002265 [Malassezia furfur]